MCGLLFVQGDADEKQFRDSLESISHRGPDDTQIIQKKNFSIGFKRLAIMGLNSSSNQPFIHKNNFLVCNGEIYNYKKLALTNNITVSSGSDCEIILPLLERFTVQKVASQLDGEFAFVALVDGRVVAARDAMGIRPLFYGKTDIGEICFASEVKALQKFCHKIAPFPPGAFYDGQNIHYFRKLYGDVEYSKDDLPKVGEKIKSLLEKAVIKRMQSDAPIGFLLSGGLDSSLVCSIAAKYMRKQGKRIRTFAIGMEDDAIDLKYAQEVADFIQSDHTQVIISTDEAISSIEEVVRSLESWDITTIRASIGMYQVCKYIKENTDIKVLMTGEVSDEIFGYKYTDFAPDSQAFQAEAAKRVEELFLYDVLRADRCISAHSLEARVPFSDNDFVSYVMSVNPELKMNSYGHGKYLLRLAFDDGSYLPNSLLFREKAAFSDAVGHSMVDAIKLYCEALFNDQLFKESAFHFKYSRPFTKESLYYRQLFVKHYPGLEELIPGFWMPNKDWENCNVDDPSARALPNYGASGT